MFFFEIKKQNKMVYFNNIVDVVLIPSKEEYNDYFFDLWYNNNELQKFRKEAFIEANIYASLKNITIQEAISTIYNY